MKRKTDAVTQNISRKLFPKIDKPFTVLQVRNYMTTVDVNETHKNLSINRVMLADRAWDFLPATEVELHDDVP